MKNIEVPIDPNEEAENLLTKLNDGIERAKYYGVPKEEMDNVLSKMLNITTDSSFAERIRAINSVQNEKQIMIDLRGFLAKLAPDMIVEDQVRIDQQRRMALPLHDAIFALYHDGGSLVVGGKDLSCKEAIGLALSGNGEVRELRLLTHVQLERRVSMDMPDEEVLREVYMSKETE